MSIIESESTMFTQGLDSEAIRWIEEGYSKSSNLAESSGDTIDSVAAAFGDTEPSRPVKFLSGSIPRLRTDPTEYSGSVSENDLTTDSEEDTTYRASCSLNSSPPDDRISKPPNHKAVTLKQGFRDDDAAEGRGYENRAPRDSPSSEISLHVMNKVYLFIYFFLLRCSIDFQDDDIPGVPPRHRRLPELTVTVSSSEDDADRISSAPANDGEGEAVASSSNSYIYRVPTFHASSQGPWLSVISYEACVRLCLHAWSRGCVEAPVFLENECAILRDGFLLRRLLLQSEEELLSKNSSAFPNETASNKPRNNVGKLKVQVRKVRMIVDPPTGCCGSAATLDLHRRRLSKKLGTAIFSAGKIRPTTTSAISSLANRTSAYFHACTQYVKQVFRLTRFCVTSPRSDSLFQQEDNPVGASYSCLLRLKSSTEDAVRMQPGSGGSHMFFPDSISDDLIIEVNDSKGRNCGRVLAQVATIADDPSDKLRWWSIYQEPEHEPVGKVQLYITYSASLDENNNLKCGSIAETVAYDLVLEAAMKSQKFRERNLLLRGGWKWLLREFSTHYSVSDSYARLRYLTYVMDVATPTADCLSLIYDLLHPVVGATLSHQENRILGEIKEQIEQLLALVFENYKSLDESFPSGIGDVFRPAREGLAAPPSLQHAVKLYSLLHDISTPDVQINLCKYFQTATRKRTRRHLSETDEFVAARSFANATSSAAYAKMKSVCVNIRDEISTDIEIENQNVLPSFVDLPNLSASIYSVELCSRLRAFLTSLPPSRPSSHVVDLVVATANFHRDLNRWNVKGGVDAKELFHVYIVVWIQEMRDSLLESCRLDKVKWSGVRTEHRTTPFVDDVYDRIKENLNDYDVIVRRWPEYNPMLERALAEIEKAVMEALDKQYADVLAPLKEHLQPRRFGLKYVQKLTKRSGRSSYVVPDDLGILLNSMKRMLDVLRPEIETRLKSWPSVPPVDDGAGECLSEVTVMLRAKFRNYLQAVVEKLVENTRLQRGTKLKKILQECKESVTELEVRGKMAALVVQLIATVDHLHSVCGGRVFVALCRGYWDRIGQDLLHFLESRKENSTTWYKGSRMAASILDGAFVSRMQKLMGHSFAEKDLEPPRSIMEVRSVLCRDMHNRQDYY